MKLLIFLCFFGILKAEEFRVPEIVVDAIKNNECLKEKGVCNPYVIRINKQEDIDKALLNGVSINKNLIKCQTKENCISSAERLSQIGIKNMDLGPYQINYFYHPTSFETYFEENSVREKVHFILSDLIKRYGYSWETLGRYHKSVEFDSIANRNYYLKLNEYISKN